MYLHPARTMVFQSAPHPKTGGNARVSSGACNPEQVSIRPPSEDRGKPGTGHRKHTVSIRPPSEDRGKRGKIGRHLMRQPCFNPPPIRRQGETATQLKSAPPEAGFNPPPIRRQGETSHDRDQGRWNGSVSIRPPSEDRGKPERQRMGLDFICVSIRPPSEDRGKHLFQHLQGHCK